MLVIGRAPSKLWHFREQWSVKQSHPAWAPTLSKLRTLRQRGKGTLREEGYPGKGTLGRATSPCDSAMHCMYMFQRALLLVLGGQRWTCHSFCPKGASAVVKKMSRCTNHNVTRMETAVWMAHCGWWGKWSLCPELGTEPEKCCLGWLHLKAAFFPIRLSNNTKIINWT